MIWLWEDGCSVKCVACDVRRVACSVYSEQCTLFKAKCTVNEGTYGAKEKTERSYDSHVSRLEPEKKVLGEKGLPRVALSRVRLTSFTDVILSS